MTCPCGSGQPYDACCGRFHHGEQPATAEQLMRARYSAFVRDQFDFLRATGTDASVEELEKQAKKTRWLGLTVRSAEAGTARDVVGFVSFSALFLDDGKLTELQERSRFEKRDGRWVYVDGEAKLATPKLGRNELCPCGSGKKLKHCHG